MEIATVWAGKYKQTLYGKDGGYASTTDTQEYVFLNFAAGEKTSTLGIYGEPNNASIAALNDYSQKTVHVYQRVGGTDVELGQIIINPTPW